MKKIFWIISIFLACTTLVGCTPIKMSTLMENFCALPCWNGVVPGETNYDDTLKEIEKMSWVDSFEGNSTQLYVKIRDAKESSAQIFFSSNRVSNIEILTEQWDMSEILGYFGEPDTYLSFYEMYERTNGQVFLYYPDDNFIIIINDVKFAPGTKNNFLSLNSEILGIILFPEDESISQFLQTTGLSSNFVSSNLHKWEGIGELVTERYIPQ